MNNDIQTILISVAILSVIGGLSGALLAYAADKFKVVVDPRVQEVFGMLPSVNCGACGCPSCMAFAEAVVAGKVSTDACKVGGAELAKKLAAKLGR
jgi:Na+-translocating ferredoxin:NAD+ oxidoreductase subunit B